MIFQLACCCGSGAAGQFGDMTTADSQNHSRPKFPHHSGWPFGRGEGTAPPGPKTSHTETLTWPKLPVAKT